ncbi:MAG: F0F1 ATP synthase subunit gamma [Planctomycetia bacterium]|nr:F0F1 ATP synthase subunit gamma [Planctomycetia bacterium]
MAGAKEIRTQIKSIQNTQKITKAMQMVAASKMRKAQERMRASRPYAEKMRTVVAHMGKAHPEYKHPYLMQREARRVGLIVVSTDQGLCGGLNTNLFKSAIRSMQEWRDQNLEIDIAVIGAKAMGFFRRLGGNVVSENSHLGDTPRIEELIGSVKVMLDAYDEGDIDRLYLANNVFVNTMSQNPTIEQLLPVVGDDSDKELGHHWDYIYEPDAREVMDGLLMRYIESLVYQGLVENISCEMAARMVAMKAASDNAGDLIGELQLIYNKVRQGAITQELSEIVSGAAAV